MRRRIEVVDRGETLFRQWREGGVRDGWGREELFKVMMSTGGLVVCPYGRGARLEAGSPFQLFGAGDFIVIGRGESAGDSAQCSGVEGAPRACEVQLQEVQGWADIKK